MSHAGLRPELIAFLRDHGCIAYGGGAGEVTALIPELEGAAEVNAIAGLAEKWRFANPLVELELTR
jgi:hypothetical protein